MKYSCSQKEMQDSRATDSDFWEEPLVIKEGKKSQSEGEQG